MCSSESSSEQLSRPHCSTFSTSTSSSLKNCLYETRLTPCATSFSFSFSFSGSSLSTSTRVICFGQVEKKMVQISEKAQVLPAEFRQPLLFLPAESCRRRNSYLELSSSSSHHSLNKHLINIFWPHKDQTGVFCGVPLPFFVLFAGAGGAIIAPSVASPSKLATGGTNPGVPERHVE